MGGQKLKCENHIKWGPNETPNADRIPNLASKFKSNNIPPPDAWAKNCWKLAKYPTMLLLIPYYLFVK